MSVADSPPLPWAEKLSVSHHMYTASYPIVLDEAICPRHVEVRALSRQLMHRSSPEGLNTVLLESNKIMSLHYQAFGSGHPVSTQSHLMLLSLHSHVGVVRASSAAQPHRVPILSLRLYFSTLLAAVHQPITSREPRGSHVGSSLAAVVLWGAMLCYPLPILRS
jgi:hypothetical protein